MIFCACLGHWYVQLLFAVPSVGMIAAIGRDSVRRRWNARRGKSGTRGSAPAGGS